jgi:hypothetical protein
MAPSADREKLIGIALVFCNIVNGHNKSPRSIFAANKSRHLPVANLWLRCRVFPRPNAAGKKARKNFNQRRRSNPATIFRIDGKLHSHVICAVQRGI